MRRLVSAPRKRGVKPECRHGCRFIPITDQLWLCPHASYGHTSNLIDAVKDARAMMDRAGGYEVLLAQLVREDEGRRVQREKERQPVPPLRYG